MNQKQEFSELVRANQGIIHKITLVYCCRYEDREDLFQEICLQLWKSYPKFRKESKFSTWVYRVALNTAISYLRKDRNQICLDDLQDQIHPDSDDSEKSEQVQIMYQAISLLNRVDKAIILLWLEEKSYDDISSILGISKSNVSVKLVRIKKQLEEIINRHER